VLRLRSCLKNVGYLEGQLNGLADAVVEVELRNLEIALVLDEYRHDSEIDLPLFRSGSSGIVSDERGAGLRARLERRQKEAGQ
jgi:hypothetical protein